MADEETAEGTGEGGDGAGVMGQLTGLIHTCWQWLKRLLLVLALLLLTAFLAALLGTEDASHRASITEDDLTTEEQSAMPQSTEWELFRSLLQVVRAMHYSDLNLQGGEAVKISGAFIPDGAKITVKELDFFYNSQKVTLHYEREGSSDVYLEFTPGYFKKTFTRYEGVAVKFTLRELYKTLRWYTWGQFWTGYTQYTYETDMWDGQPGENRSITRQVFKIAPFGKVTRFFHLVRRMASMAAAA